MNAFILIALVVTACFNTVSAGLFGSSGSQFQFEIDNKISSLTEGDEITLKITPTEKYKHDITFAANRLGLTLKYDNHSPKPVPGSKLSVEGDHLIAHFVVPKPPSSSSFQVSICLTDFRPTMAHHLNGKNTKGCSRNLRIVPPTGAAAGVDDIQGPVNQVGLVRDSAGLFESIPVSLQSNKVYDLNFTMMTTLVTSPSLLSVHLASSSMRKGPLPIETKLIKALDQNAGRFNVRFRTPQLDSKSRSFKICVSSKGDGRIRVMNKVVCSAPVMVGELGRVAGGSGGENPGETAKTPLERQITESRPIEPMNPPDSPESIVEPEASSQDDASSSTTMEPKSPRSPGKKLQSIGSLGRMAAEPSETDSFVDASSLPGSTISRQSSTGSFHDARSDISRASSGFSSAGSSRRLGRAPTEYFDA